ncbi:MAG: phosphoglycerate kinase [Candidatus Vogelbacteria bacterium]
MNSTLPLLADIPPAQLRGKRILLRLDLNVLIENEVVTDDFRIISSLPTIEYLRAQGSRIAIISHLGREPEETLLPIANFLGKFFPVRFCPTVANLKSMVADLPEGGVLLLENIRREAGEETNDDSLARALAETTDFYVNDAFASAHRAHASIVGIPRYLPSFAGLRFAKEVENLERAFTPAHPFLVILGGAKFETKLPLIERFITLADKIVVYGALAHAFFKELGYELGESLVEKETAVARPFLHHPKIILPADVRVKNGARIFIKTPDTLIATDNILDVGLISIEQLLPVIRQAKFILWNGPLGNFEHGFHGSTEAVAKFISASNAESIVGGGDTIASIRALNILDQFDFVSTGGGAMLDFLAQGTLPGIEALKTSPPFS